MKGVSKTSKNSIIPNQSLTVAEDDFLPNKGSPFRKVGIKGAYADNSVAQSSLKPYKMNKRRVQNMKPSKVRPIFLSTLHKNPNSWDQMVGYLEIGQVED